MRESSGRERAANPTSSARGLLQLMSGWYTGAWGPPAGNPLDATYNLKTGLWIWKHGGFSAWAL
jgi:soluble lytic murein transglycosylase-like protein